MKGEDHKYTPARLVKNPSAMQETLVQFLGWEDPLEKGMVTHSSILAWRILMDWGAWWATVHGVAKCRTWLEWLMHNAAEHTHTYICVYIKNEHRKNEEIHLPTWDIFYLLPEVEVGQEVCGMTTMSPTTLSFNSFPCTWGNLPQ